VNTKCALRHPTLAPSPSPTARFQIVVAVASVHSHAARDRSVAWADLPSTGLKGLRIAYSPDLGLGGVDPDVTALVKAAVEKMAEVGAHVSEVTPPIGDMNDTIDVLWQSGCAYGQRPKALRVEARPIC
jgi:Asp-tRNA(Asn)/Glu-tRNA(Gln) amidotransferase A subunit family amidase